jgi:hypothetical protein
VHNELKENVVQPKDLEVILVLEGKGNKGRDYQWYRKNDEDIPEIDYEKEAIRCIKSIRSAGGKYKDIKIHVINPTKNAVRQETRDYIKSVNNCYYAHVFMKETENYDCSWINVAIVGKWLETDKLCEDKYFLHIDLDMILLKEFDEDLMTLNSGITKVGIYDKDNIYDKRDYGYPTDAVTCLILSKASDKFYTKWLHKIDEMIAELPEGTEARKYNDIEEVAVDVMAYDDGEPITFVDGTMLGPGYLNANSIKTEEQKNKVHFIHAHDYQNPDQYIADWLRL